MLLDERTTNLMGKTTIHDCPVPQCPADACALGNNVSVRFCSVCNRNVYDCSAGVGSSDWRRIAPDKDSVGPLSFSVDDVVRIVVGPYEGFDATIFELVAEDHAARVYLNIFGGVPFWIALRCLEPLDSEP
jgi:hypothetical protein